jgi:hypothetical protein
MTVITPRLTARGRGACALLLGSLLSSGVAPGASLSERMEFAADMARRGNWREARYRWEQALEAKPDDPRLLNNLAVALEALGEPDGARALYERAARAANGDDTVEANRLRFERFRRSLQEGGDDDGSEDREPLARGGDRLRGKTLRVTVPLPLPARLDLTGAHSLLVAAVRTHDSDLLDLDREIVRFLRGKFRSVPSLEVLDVTPPPAITEQSIDDLLANQEFWRHVGREYGADLVVSGVLTFERRDASGFRDVDVVSPVTGHKVRETRFVEQEEFAFVLDVFFMDGASGALRFRDRLQRASVYPAMNNDPITAFYDLAETVAGDVLAVVRPRTREEVRVVFRG